MSANGQGVTTYLNTQQEKLQVEIMSRQHIFIRNRHQDRGAAVAEDREHGVVGDGRPRGRRPSLRLRPRLEAIGAELLHINGIVVALLHVSHDGVGGCLARKQIALVLRLVFCSTELE